MEPRFRALRDPGYLAEVVEDRTAAAVLAYLSLHPGSNVGAATLTDQLWGDRDEPPKRPRRALSTAVSRLRRQIGQERLHRGKSGGEGALYRLDADRSEIDLWRFYALAAEADDSARRGDFPGASQLYERALALWFDDGDLPHLRSYPFLEREFVTHQRARTDVLLRKLRADIGCGRTDEVAAHAAAMTRDDPTNQRLAELRALALYVGGHRDQALGVIQSCLARLPDTAEPAPTLITTRDLIETGKSADPALERFSRSAYIGADPWWMSLPPLRRPAHCRRIATPLRCPPVETGSDQRVLEALHNLKKWSESALGLFEIWPGGRIEVAAATYREWFDELAERSGVWDFRYGKHERQSAPDAAALTGEPIRPDDAARIIEIAARLGMRDPLLPLRAEYDAAIVMGGARMAPLLRMRWLADLAKDHSFHVVSFAGSLRPVIHPIEVSQIGYVAKASEETRVANGYTEFALLDAAAAMTPELFPDMRHTVDEEWWPPGDRTEQAVWAAHRRIWRYHAIGHALAIGYAAPSDNPRDHRPRTSETLRFVCDDLGRRGRLPHGDSVLLSTSAIYVPYQQIEATRVLGLPRGLYVETVAHPLEWSRPPGTKVRSLHTPENYLQETRSALQACAQLAADFPEHSRAPIRN